MADKTKTIKGATDKELDELIARLRKESEAQSLVSEIKRKSGSGYMPYDQGQEISTEVPIESLYHFGVLGMHWGHKKGNSSTSSINRASKHDDDSEDYTKKERMKTKKLRTLSNAELKAFNERLQLEKQYKDLTKTEISPGKKFVTDILSSSAKTVATTYVTKYATKGLEKILKSAENS
jgi:hypothetical protein